VINISETDIQNEIRKALSEYGIVLRMNTGVFKTEDGRTVKCGMPGTSDLLFIGNKYIAWIEVKTPTGRPTQEQLKFINIMQGLGHRAGIARSVEEALEIIK
jgi:hypothetical protein